MRAKEKMPDLKSLQLFDSCVTLGRMVLAGCPEYLTPENILPVMDKYEIQEALVHNHHARVTYPREHGNQQLLKAIRKMPRLHPAWVLEPPKRIGKKAAADLVNQMLDNGVKAARLRMKMAPPMLWLWSDLLDALDKHHIPCFLDFGGVSTVGDLTNSDIMGIREIALAHPDLPLVFSNVVGGLGINCAVVPLIKRLPNLYIDITGILEFWREVAADTGPERVLFATGMPFTDPGIYISNVQYARNLDVKARQMICGGNLRKLLGGVR
jgi:predicted TIM-barrel fold metal-dependent hydrolase